MLEAELWMYESYPHQKFQEITTVIIPQGEDVECVRTVHTAAGRPQLLRLEGRGCDHDA